MNRRRCDSISLFDVRTIKFKRISCRCLEQAVVVRRDAAVFAERRTSSQDDDYIVASVSLLVGTWYARFIGQRSSAHYSAACHKRLLLGRPYTNASVSHEI